MTMNGDLVYVRKNIISNTRNYMEGTYSTANPSAKRSHVFHNTMIFGTFPICGTFVKNAAQSMNKIFSGSNFNPALDPANFYSPEKLNSTPIHFRSTNPASVDFLLLRDASSAAGSAPRLASVTDDDLAQHRYLG